MGQQPAPLFNTLLTALTENFEPLFEHKAQSTRLYVERQETSNSERRLHQTPHNMGNQVVRGRCDSCGKCRNIWVHEGAIYFATGAKTGIKCSECNRGTLWVAYVGPESNIPASMR